VRIIYVIMFLYIVFYGYNEIIKERKTNNGDVLGGWFKNFELPKVFLPPGPYKNQRKTLWFDFGKAFFGKKF